MTVEAAVSDADERGLSARIARHGVVTDALRLDLGASVSVQELVLRCHDREEGVGLVVCLPLGGIGDAHAAEIVICWGADRRTSQLHSHLQLNHNRRE